MELALGKSDFAIKIADLIQPYLGQFGYEVVQVQVNSGNRLLLKILIGRKDYQKMTLDECADMSRQISVLLDSEDPIASEYVLEVSSAGIDRPLVRERDFEYYQDYEIKLKTKEMIENRSRFKGVLTGLQEGSVKIANDEETYSIPFDHILEAKLTLSDKLLKDKR